MSSYKLNNIDKKLEKAFDENLSINEKNENSEHRLNSVILSKINSNAHENIIPIEGEHTIDSTEEINSNYSTYFELRNSEVYFVVKNNDEVIFSKSLALLINAKIIVPININDIKEIQDIITLVLKNDMKDLLELFSIKEDDINIIFKYSYCITTKKIFHIYIPKLVLKANFDTKIGQDIYMYSYLQLLIKSKM